MLIQVIKIIGMDCGFLCPEGGNHLSDFVTTSSSYWSAIEPR